MADNRGGYRQPAKPASVSGPGALSKRTDGKQPMRAGTGLGYGNKIALLKQEAGAPMAATPSVTPAPVSAPAAPGGAPAAPYGGMNFGGPTQMPNQPITHGVDIGPGAGPEALPLPAQPTFQAQGPMTQMLAQMGPLSGPLASMYQFAASRGV